MQQGKYLNPKYELRRKKLRRAVLSTCVLTLLIVAAGTAWQVDYTIRGTMLPAAPPIAAVEQGSPHSYRISLLGHEFELSLSGVYAASEEASVILRTPPAPLRLCYQLRAYFTDTLPQNLRREPREALKG